MLDPSIHVTLQHHFGRQAPDIQPAYCLNNRHKDAGCRLCVDACPTGAIALSQTAPIHPVIGDDNCIRCGACIAICPTDVFSQPLPPESAMLRTLADVPASTSLTIICPLHPQPEQNQAPPPLVMRHQRCLASLSLNHVLALSQQGERELWLDDSYCHACPIASQHEQIKSTLESARRLQAAFDHRPSIHSHTLDAGALLPAPHPVTVLDITRPAYTRRGLFKALGQIVQQRTNEIIDQLPPPRRPDLPVSERMKPHLPPSRRYLNRLVRGLADRGQPHDTPQPTAALPYGNLRIDDAACSGCQLCARFCPSGALQWQTETAGENAPTIFHLNFQPSLCLDCNICTLICPEDAITMLDTVRPADLLAEHGETLVQGELVPCAQCGTPTRPPQDDSTPLCHICRRSIGKQPSLLSDLFSKREKPSP